MTVERRCHVFVLIMSTFLSVGFATSSTTRPTALPSRAPSSRVPFDAPVLSTCQYADDMSHILVIFNKATNRGGVKSPYACDAVILFDGSETSTCSFNSDGVSFNIYPSLDIAVPVSTVLTLRPSVLQAACPLLASVAECLAWPAAPQQNCTIAAAANPIQPVVVITAPSILGICDSFVLDVTSSSGSAGGDWVSFAVTVGPAVGITLPADADALEAFYAHDYTISPHTPYPAKNMTALKSYVLTVTLCNIAGLCASAKHSVNVADVQVPAVTILGSPFREIRASQELTLVSSAVVNYCDGSNTFSDLYYTWLVYEGETPAGVHSSSSIPTKFKLSPNTLVVGHTYTVQLSVEWAQSPLTSSRSVQVRIIPSFVTARVAGASSRSLRFGDVLNIDASGSSDDDVADVTGAAAGLVFSWYTQCFLNDVSVANVLEVTTNAATTDTATVQFTSPDITDMKCRVIVKVSGPTGQRFDTTSVDIAAIPPASPVVALTADTKRVLLLQKVKIMATVETFATASVQWFISDKTINLASTALTPTSSSLSPGKHTFNFVLVRGALYAGATFTFSLVVGSSASSIQVSVVGTPGVGKFTVTPSTGYAIKTQFLLSVSRWQEKELPLTYSFGFVTSRSNSAVLTPRSELTYIKTMLSGGGVVTCTVTGYNALNAFSLAYADATLLAREITVTDVDNMLSTVSTPGSAAPAEVKRAVAIASASLNTVNCSRAPNCASLNRKKCAAVAHTCGVCMDGYMGDSDGAGNSLCFTAAVLSTPIFTYGCSSDADCASSSLFCNVERTCKLMSKSCPADCSGNGECIMLDVAYGQVVAQCLLGDVTCEASCMCGEGFSGPSCSITAAEIESRRSTRISMVNMLKNATSSDELTATIVLEMVEL